MFGSMVLEVAIGVIFVYLLLSLIVTAVTELISGWLRWRSQNLWEGVRNLVDSDQAAKWATLLYEHPLIQGLRPAERPPAPIPADGTLTTAPTKTKVNGPSYIPSRTFAVALLETLKDADPAGQLAIKALRRAVDDTPDSASTAALKSALGEVVGTLQNDGAIGAIKGELRGFINRIPDSVSLTDAKKDIQVWLTRLPDRWLQSLIENIPDAKLKKSLSALADEAHGDVERLKTNIEVWFNNSMERVSGWYKRRTQFVHAILAACLTLFVNVDSVLVVNALSQSEALRKSVVAEAEAYAKHEAGAGLLPASATSADESSSPAMTTDTMTTEAMTTEAMTTEAMTTEAMTTEVMTTDTMTTALAPVSPAAPKKTVVEKKPDAAETFKRLRSQISQLNLPVGWVLPDQADKENRDFRKWPGWVWEPGKENDWATLWAQTIRFHFFGWLLTAFAISLGAPFWFDMLNKVINIRSSGKAPGEKPKAPQVVPQPQAPGQQPAS